VKDVQSRLESNTRDSPQSGEFVTALKVIMKCIGSLNRCPELVVSCIRSFPAEAGKLSRAGCVCERSGDILRVWRVRFVDKIETNLISCGVSPHA
jgi:hypothetical protein